MIGRIALRRLFKIVNGGTPTGDAANWGGTIQWATPVDVGAFDGAMLGHTDRTLTEKGLSSGSRLVPAGSLIVSNRAPIGYVAQTTVPTAFNQGCKGLVPLRELDIRYFRYVLGVAKDSLDSLGQGSTFVELSAEALGSYQVPYPSPHTQRAIADYLDTETARIDALITKKREMSDLERDRFQIRAFGQTVGGPQVPLRRLARTVQTGTTPRSSEMDRLVADADVEWISPGDVGELLDAKPAARSLNEDALRERHCPEFPSNSTLFVGIGATAGRVAHLDRRATGNQQVTCVVAGPMLDQRFLSWQLWSRQEELRATAPYTTLPIISNEFIRALPISVPAKREQERVAKDLDQAAVRVSELRRKLETQISLLREHRTALITSAVAGEFEIRGAT